MEVNDGKDHRAVNSLEQFQKKKWGASQRNKQPIADILVKYIDFSKKGTALEIASGQGVHVIHFAGLWKEIYWTPSDYCDISNLHAKLKKYPNIEVPLTIDVTTPIEQWNVKRNYDLMININMVHISPWSTTQGLMKAAPQLLRKGGLLVMYGPYNVDGNYTSEGNRRFDSHLRGKNPSWGIRNIEDVIKEAISAGLTYIARHAMPANNFSIIFKKDKEITANSLEQFQKKNWGASQRNKQPISDILAKYINFSEKGTALEIASGQGTHVIHFAGLWKTIHWTPSDYCDISNLHAKLKQYSNIEMPLVIDVTTPIEHWNVKRGYDLVININMIHISPWSTTQGLMKAAPQLLREGGLLVMYGPYNVDGNYTSDGNRRFDSHLRGKNPSWGIRNIEDVIKEATSAGLTYITRHAMPANNFSIIFKKDKKINWKEPIQEKKRKK